MSQIDKEIHLKLLRYLLQNHGQPSRQTLMVLSAVALLGGAIGLSGHFAHISDSLMFTLFALLCVAYFLGVRRLAKAMPNTDRFFDIPSSN